MRNVLEELEEKFRAADLQALGKYTVVTRRSNNCAKKRKSFGMEQARGWGAREDKAKVFVMA
ncbi:hypothetical protein KGM_201786 [Danaus plexippus plexippus]|uniref:Uncharacterized protein n=1 Tax=Danaus plexippus plexippus TaxID=278856 RepID=A0A212FJ56_DANPL|nr:hypothetical protein KGM_201786 [Danaus plexippus plexippus]